MFWFLCHASFRLDTGSQSKHHPMGEARVKIDVMSKANQLLIPKTNSLLECAMQCFSNIMTYDAFFVSIKCFIPYHLLSCTK